MKKGASIILLIILLMIAVGASGCGNTEPPFSVKDAKAYPEGACLIFEGEGSDCDVYIHNEDSSEDIKIDDQLIMKSENGYIAYALGLRAGKYSFVIRSGRHSVSSAAFDVEAYDRSGYAHFKNESGVGAYNNDGSLKENAEVVYVDESTKNTVSLNIGGETYTGLGVILKNADKCSHPLDIRIIGKIDTACWNTHTYNNSPNTPEILQEQKELMHNITEEIIPESTIIDEGINSFSDDLAKGVTQLNGLDNYAMYDPLKDEYDGQWNMLRLYGISDVTIEGVGPDAGIEHWGISFHGCHSIEVRNLTFSGYNDDAINAANGVGEDKDSSGYFFHHLRFLPGSITWDLTLEQDKSVGDGALDITGAHGLTVAYCHFDHTKKTELLGENDRARQYDVTIHHNIYDSCTSRLPLLRHANCHIYNNLYLNASQYCMSIRVQASAFIEQCFFDGSNNPMMLAYSSGGGQEPVGTTIKAIDNIFNNVGKLQDHKTLGIGLAENGIYVITGKDENKAYTYDAEATRLTKASGSICEPVDGLDLSNFDTDPEIFYFDAARGVSDVERMDKAEDLPDILPGLVGPVLDNAQ